MGDVDRPERRPISSIFSSSSDDLARHRLAVRADARGDLVMGRRWQDVVARRTA